MTDQLYQDRIVSLAKAKTGAGKLASPTKSARRDNPLCGDRVTIDVKLDDRGRVPEIAHQVRGCLLCQALAASAWPSVAVGRNAAGIENCGSTPKRRHRPRRGRGRRAVRGLRAGREPRRLGDECVFCPSKA